MRRRNLTARALMATAALAVTLVMSGCSAEDGAPRVAGDDGSAASAPQDGNAIRRSWVTCMHGQGQNQVQQDKDGNIYTPAAGTDGSGNIAAYEAAVKVCDAKNPGIRQVNEKVDRKFAEMGRAWVACARKHGYADLPDPDPKDGVLVIPSKSFDAAKWDAVQPACSKLPLPGYRIGE
ncbi:hypothetical protein [Streptomyces sp. NPDC056144]|uniref:hypothetical protein n=1 Tax=unclassified Streptomyces TaxID=2593676 RepID=UPI0035D76845